MRLLILLAALQSIFAANYDSWEYQLYDYEYGEDDYTPEEVEEFVDFTTFPPSATAHCNVCNYLI